MKPDPNLFSIPRPTPPEQELRSLIVNQATIELAAEGQPPLRWPPVPGGKTTGLLSMYISVDREGRVREAYPLNSDNAQLQDAARDQLLQWKLKPLVSKGVSVQVESALSFRFETTLAAKGTEPPAEVGTPGSSETIAPAILQVSKGTLQGLREKDFAPVYPAEAKKNRIQGRVVLALTIDKTGTPREIRVVTSPDQSLTDSAIAAVSQWRYRPYQLNGSAIAVQSTVEVNFQLR